MNVFFHPPQLLTVPRRPLFICGGPYVLPQNLARALQAPAPWSMVVRRADAGGGWGRSVSGGVRLDLSAAQALQSALQRGGFMPRGKAGLVKDTAAATSAPAPAPAAAPPSSSAVTGGSTAAAGGRGDVGNPGGRHAGGGGGDDELGSEGSSHGTRREKSGGERVGGGPATATEGGGDYSYSHEGGVMAYYDDGTDGRRRRLLLPPPPVGREETALVCKLFRLSRDLTALRVHRCGWACAGSAPCAGVRLHRRGVRGRHAALPADHPGFNFPRM